MSLHYDCLENINEAGNSMRDSDFGEFEYGTKTNVSTEEPNSNVFDPSMLINQKFFYQTSFHLIKKEEVSAMMKAKISC